MTATVTKLATFTLHKNAGLQDPAEMSLDDVKRELREHGTMLREQMLKRFNALHAASQEEQVGRPMPTVQQLVQLTGLAEMSDICAVFPNVFEEDRRGFSLLLTYLRAMSKADAADLDSRDVPNLLLSFMGNASGSKPTRHMRDLYKHAERIEEKNHFTGPKV